jgi:Icc-related predicted phosphoesterase
MLNGDEARAASVGLASHEQSFETMSISPLMPISPDRVRIAAVSDIHCSRTSQGTLQPIFAAAAERADVIAICGDLTDYGLPDEARVLVKELAGIRAQVVAVLGNHDYESGKQIELHDILNDAGVHVLDGEAVEILGVGFAGTKGFAGGFGSGTLGAWGEAEVKSFVNEAIHEALKLETALARIRTEPRVAIMHYSPIRGTVVGESPEIFPFLGCGRLEEPLSRYPVAAVLHGHAHNGTPEGATAGGAPVYNVAMPLLLKLDPDALPVKFIEVAARHDTHTTEVPPRAYIGPERRSGSAATRSTGSA